MGESGDLVHLLLHRLARDDVLEMHLPAEFGQDWQRIGVPLHEEDAGIDVLSIRHLEGGAVRDRVPLLLPSLGVLNDQRARAVGDDEVAPLAAHR